MTEIEKEQLFPAIGITKEKRDYLLELINNLKDIKNSEFNGHGTLLNLFMEDLQNNIIYGSGIISYENENCSIELFIFNNNNKLIFDSKITGLTTNKQYCTLDVFKFNKDTIKQESTYNIKQETYYETLKLKKGRIK